MTRGAQALALALVLALAGGAAEAADEDFCASVTSCLKDGSATCLTASGDCPPCVYTLADSYSCWEKDNSTNTCPFTGVRYDCTDAWGSSGSSSATAGSASNATAVSSAESGDASSSAATASSGSGSEAISTSSLITYIAIGVAVLLVLIIACVVWRRKRQSARARRDLHTPPHAKRDRGMSKRDDALTGPYNNIPDTTKGGAFGPYNNSTSTVATTATGSNRTGNYSNRSNNRNRGHTAPRKHSDGVAMMEAQRDSDHSFVSIVPTEHSNSIDGILGERSPSVLGDEVRSHKTRASRPGGVVVGGIGGFGAVNEKLVQQDVANRCTTSANMYDEYMRMKQEMNYGEDDDLAHTHDDDLMSDAGLSDFESDTMSMHKFSLESSTGMHKFSLESSTGMLARHHDNGLSLTDSVTDSEYAAAMRDRGESDCFSEMSYNDEKYSFSESDFDATSLDGSHARGAKDPAKTDRKTDREVEI